MFAKQTMASASLVVVIACVLAESAHADPEERTPTGTFEVGAGYSSFEGFLARARVEQSSLFGSGHMLALDARISLLRQEFNLEYASADLGDGLSLSAELFARQLDLPAFTRRGVGAAVAVQQQVSPNTRFFLGYRIEQVEQPVDVRIAAVNLGMIYETPRTTLGLTSETAYRALGSDVGFTRMNAWVRHREPIGPLTLHLGGSATTIVGDVPLSERMFIDGITDVRGYAPGALMRHGGTTKVAGRAELEVPLIRSIGLSAAGFVDVGGLASDRVGVFGASAGIGLRWRTPIGTMTFDWAVPLDGGKPRFLFGIGSW